MYGFQNFELRTFFSSRYSSHNRSTAGRILNKFINALNEHNTLPKLVIVILDDDLVYDIPNDSNLFSKIHNISTWLIREFEKNLEIYKDYLPIKAKQKHLPQIMWITPPVHKYFCNNRKREMLMDCIFKETKVRKDMVALKMVKVWDPEDSNSYIYESDRFTSEGLMKYWLSVDSALHYWNVAIFPKIGKPKQPKHKNMDCFHWKRTMSQRWK